MDIILDSNIFRADILLRSKDFDVLNDFLRKTSSKLLIPQIILDEILGLYKRTLNERSQEAFKFNNNLNLMLIDSKMHIEFQNIDFEKEVNNYRNHLFKRLGINTSNIISYNNELLPVIAKRAIERTKPSGEKGQGFRDTLIWLTMLKYCKTSHEKQMIFISNNTDDFSSSDKQSLHESLSNECESIGIKINYFKNLKEFIERHSSKIDFLNLDWINENLDFKTVEEIIQEDLNGKERRGIISHLQSETSGECTGYHVDYVETNKVDELYIYEMLDNKLIVNLTLNLMVGLEGSFRHDDSFQNEYAYFETSLVKYLRLDATISFEVVDKEIGDIELSDIDF